MALLPYFFGDDSPGFVVYFLVSEVEALIFLRNGTDGPARIAGGDSPVGNIV